MSKKKKRNKAKEQLPKKIPSWVSPLSLGLLVIGTFLLRTLPSWNKVFVDGTVWFKGADPWYHMRLVDNMMANFPLPLKLDMFILYPEGLHVGYFPLLSWMIALPGQIFNYELVGAFLPPIIGALILIPIFFICKTLWKDWVGLIACLLVMILPTEILHRTLLGFTDHHMLEVLFSVSTISFLVLLSKKRRLLWAILGGLSFGLYMSSWVGGLLLTLPIWTWFFITFLSKLRKGESVKTFCTDLSIVFGIGLLLFSGNLFFLGEIGSYVILLGLITLSPIVLLWGSTFLSWKKLLAGTVVILGLLPIITQLVSPSLLATGKAIFISPGSTIQEALPSYPKVFISHYGLSFLLFLGGLGFAIKRKENLLLLLWCLFMFMLVIGQRRWSYYFAVNNAILASYFIYLIREWVHKTTQSAVVIIICVILILTTFKSTIGLVNLPGMLSPSWYQTCIWLKENTPEVEGYYDLEMNETDYGVLSWWDYGNWITRIGQRIPCSNPMAQTSAIQWQVFLAHSEEEANEYLEDVEYIIVDSSMVTGKFYAIERLAPKGWEITQDTFIFKLWEERTTTWKKIYQYGEVKVYGRS